MLTELTLNRVTTKLCQFDRFENHHRGNPTLRLVASALRHARFANLEIFDFSAGFYGSDQPARLLPPARPCFGRRLRITIFGKNPWIFASGLTISVVRLRAISPLEVIPAPIENRQTLLKFGLFRCDPFGQDPANLFVERP